MFEKDMRLTLLLDHYGDLLSAHRREIIEMYYCEDLSLADFQADIVQDFLFSKGFGDAVNDDGFAHYASSLSLFSASASF